MDTGEQIDVLIGEFSDDRELLRRLMLLADGSWDFGETVSAWGPRLYARNRTVFTPLIQRWVSPWSLKDLAVIRPWMDETKAHGDNRLFSVLYQAWLSQRIGWSDAPAKWEADFAADFEAASDRAARRDVTERYNLWYDVTDELAATLYQRDPVVTRDWLLRRLDRLEWLDVVYEKTAQIAQRAGDDDFYFALYRRSFPADVWAKDVARLAEEVTDPAELCRQLELRHLDEGVEAATLKSLLDRRGGDILPYLTKFAPTVRDWGKEKQWDALAQAAYARGYFALWSAVAKTQLGHPQFNELITRLLKQPAQDWEVASRLVQIAGAKVGWWWSRYATLEEEVALALYERFPELSRSALSAHFVVSAKAPLIAIAQRADEMGDHEMVDLLAAKALRLGRGWYASGSLQDLQWYADHYRAMDDETFAPRAVRVVGQVVEGDKFGRRSMRSENPVYKAFFDDVSRYKPALGQVRDLLEAPFETTRRLGLTLISEAGEAAVEVAARNSDHLKSYLLDEAERSTRIAAFKAAALAARSSPVIAADLLEAARDALDLRRKQYPRDRLIELIGQILYAHPSLRSAREQPVVYGAEAAW